MYPLLGRGEGRREVTVPAIFYDAEDWQEDVGVSGPAVQLTKPSEFIGCVILMTR